MKMKRLVSVIGGGAILLILNASTAFAAPLQTQEAGDMIIVSNGIERPDGYSDFYYEPENFMESSSIQTRSVVDLSSSSRSLDWNIKADKALDTADSFKTNSTEINISIKSDIKTRICSYWKRSITKWLYRFIHKYT